MDVYKNKYLLVPLFVGILLLVIFNYSSPLNNENINVHYVPYRNKIREVRKKALNKTNQIRIDDGILPDSQEVLKDEDVLITVKTGRVRESRMNEILLTWLNDFSNNVVYFITDHASAQLKIRTNFERIIETNCPTGHGRPDLVCKMAAEFTHYYVTKGRPKWWCHVDDDNYVNRDVMMRLLSRYDADNDDVYIGRASWTKPILANYEGKSKIPFWFGTGGAGFCVSRHLADKMQKFMINSEFENLSAKVGHADDVMIGFIINYLLKVEFINSRLFISHGKWNHKELKSMKVEDLKNMAVIGYTISGDARISVPKEFEYFTADEDRSGLLTFHCILHPKTDYCRKLDRIENI